VIQELFSFDYIHNLNLVETQVLVLVLNLAPEILILILRRKVLFTSLPMLSCVFKSQFKCDCIFTLNSKNNFCEDIGLLEAVRLVHYKQPSAGCYAPAVRSRIYTCLSTTIMSSYNCAAVGRPLAHATQLPLPTERLFIIASILYKTLESPHSRMHRSLWHKELDKFSSV